MRQLIVCVLLLIAIIRPATASCPAVDERDLASFMVNLAALVDESNRLTGRSTPGLQTWRSQLLRGDPEMRELSCRLLSDYPRFEPLLRQAAEQAADMAVSEKIVAPTSKGAGLCLSEGEFRSTITLHAVLNLVAIGMEGACDALGCVEAACLGPCSNLPFVKIAMEPFEGVLETSAYSCLADHIEHMNDWATGSLGAQLKRGQTTSLTEIRRRTIDELVPAINQTQSDFGRVADFEDLQALFAERLDDTNEEIAQIRGGLDVDQARRARFQDQLERLQVQQQLGASSGDLPLVLSLPASAGGRLETVREIVADAINSSAAAGLPEGRARDLLRSADALYNAGRFAGAAAEYRLAYQELVR